MLCLDHEQRAPRAQARSAGGGRPGVVDEFASGCSEARTRAGRKRRLTAGWLHGQQPDPGLDGLQHINSAAMQYYTQMPPSDDKRSERDLGITHRDPAQTLTETVDGLRRVGRLQVNIAKDEVHQRDHMASRVRSAGEPGQ